MCAEFYQIAVFKSVCYIFFQIVFLIALVAFVDASPPSLNFRIGFSGGLGLRRIRPLFRRFRYGPPPPPPRTVTYVRAAPAPLQTVQLAPYFQQIHTVAPAIPVNSMI